MISSSPSFNVRLASTPQDLLAAQRLRYKVFVEELGGDGALVDHDNKLEQDRFDPFCDHMLIFDEARESETVVGVYRLLRGDHANAAGGFYTSDEYDLTVLLEGGRNLLELGRSCLHPAYRGGPAMYHMWKGLAEYTLDHDIEVLFGTASFHGTDIDEIAEPLAFLHQRHLAPQDLRVRAVDGHYQRMDLCPGKQIDRAEAMLKVPSLIKAYLRLGGFIGDGAYVDHAFNTTDVCVILDTGRMNARQSAIYTR